MPDASHRLGKQLLPQQELLARDCGAAGQALLNERLTRCRDGGPGWEQPEDFPRESPPRGGGSCSRGSLSWAASLRERGRGRRSLFAAPQQPEGEERAPRSPEARAAAV